MKTLWTYRVSRDEDFASIQEFLDVRQPLHLYFAHENARNAAEIHFKSVYVDQGKWTHVNIHWYQDDDKQGYYASFQTPQRGLVVLRVWAMTIEDSPWPKSSYRIL